MKSEFTVGLPATTWSEMCILNIIFGKDTSITSTKSPILNGQCTSLQSKLLDDQTSSTELFNSNSVLDNYANTGVGSGKIPMSSVYSMNLVIRFFLNSSWKHIWYSNGFIYQLRTKKLSHLTLVLLIKQNKNRRTKLTLHWNCLYNSNLEMEKDYIDSFIVFKSIDFTDEFKNMLRAN